MAAIASDNVIPTDSSHLLDNILNRMTPWDTQDRSGQFWRLHKAEAIRETVRLMDGVREVKVQIDTTNVQRHRRRIANSPRRRRRLHEHVQSEGQPEDGRGHRQPGIGFDERDQARRHPHRDRQHSLSPPGRAAQRRAAAARCWNVRPNGSALQVEKIRTALGDIQGLHVSVTCG